MLAAWVIGILMAIPSPVLSVPTVHAAPDPKEIWLDALHRCENIDNVPKILDTNGKYSYGAFMFQMSTWLEYGEDFGATRENIEDADLQREVAKDMLEKGLWKHWYICGKKIITTFGDYPV